MACGGIPIPIVVMNISFGEKCAFVAEDAVNIDDGALLVEHGGS